MKIIHSKLIHAVMATALLIALPGMVLADSKTPSPRTGDYTLEDRYANTLNNDIQAKRMTESAQWQVISLGKQARTAFERAEGFKAKGDQASACKQARKAIDFDRRYTDRKSKVFPDHAATIDENLYSEIEAEYCGAAQG